MDIKFYTIKGTLERCSRQDFFDNQGFFLENKSFFIKNYWTKSFIGFYKLPNDYPLMIENPIDAALKKYSIVELEDLLRYNLLFKLSSMHHDLDFHFNLYVKTANFDDLFYRKNLLKINTCYYNYKNNGTFTGPNYISEFDDPQKFLERLESCKILVLSTKQYFEPYLIRKAS